MFVTLGIVEKMPAENDMLNISVNWVETSLSSSLNILVHAIRSNWHIWIQSRYYIYSLFQIYW